MAQELSDDGESIHEDEVANHMSLADEIRSKLAHRKTMMNIEEEFFVNRNSDVRDRCTKTLDLNMSLSSNSAFVDTYPKVRELLQNAIDYLGLCIHGVRKSNVVLASNPTSETDPSARLITFSEGDTPLLELDVSRDRLVIYQHLTYPLEKAILQNPVVDPSKRSTSSAGGFGVGAKDAVRQWIHEGMSVNYHMFGETERIDWEFKSSNPSTKSSLYSSSRGFQVHIKSKRYRESERPPIRSNHIGTNREWLQPNTLCIVVDADRIGLEMRKVYSKVALFWDVSIGHHHQLIREADGRVHFNHNGDFMCSPYMFRIHNLIVSHGDVRVSDGVYSMGLYVCNEHFTKCVYLAGSNSPCAVKRRDRNTIDSHLVRQAVQKLFGALLSSADAQVLKDAFKAQYISSGSANDASSMLRTQDAGFYKRALNSCDICKLMGISPFGYFVEQPETQNEQRKLEWATMSLIGQRRGDVQVLPPNMGSAVFTRVSVDFLVQKASMSLPVDNLVPFNKAIGLVMLFVTTQANRTKTVVYLKHSKFIGDKVYHTRINGSSIAIVADTSRFSIKAIQNVLFILMREHEHLIEDKLHAILRCIYTLNPNSSGDQILSAIERTVANASDTRLIVAPSTSTDVFSTFKRALESNGLELVRKAPRTIVLS